MNQTGKKEKKWWQYLLVIPVMLLIDIIALIITGIADTTAAGDGLGHPAPAFLLVAVIISGILTMVLTVRALILCLKTIVSAHRKTDAEEPGEKQNVAPGQKKPVWHCFIPLMIEAPIVITAVIICGYWEISSFYNDPAKIGFAFPIATFLLAGIGLLITIAIGIACITFAVIRSRRNNGAI